MVGVQAPRQPDDQGPWSVRDCQVGGSSGPPATWPLFGGAIWLGFHSFPAPPTALHRVGRNGDSSDARVCACPGSPSVHSHHQVGVSAVWIGTGCTHAHAPGANFRVPQKKLLWIAAPQGEWLGERPPRPWAREQPIGRAGQLDALPSGVLPSRDSRRGTPARHCLSARSASPAVPASGSSTRPWTGAGSAGQGAHRLITRQPLNRENRCSSDPGHSRGRSSPARERTELDRMIRIEHPGQSQEGPGARGSGREATPLAGHHSTVLVNAPAPSSAMSRLNADHPATESTDRGHSQMDVKS
jgi:hypothetical protein